MHHLTILIIDLTYSFILLFFYPNFMVSIWNLKLSRCTEYTSPLCFDSVTLTILSNGSHFDNFAAF